MGFSVLRYHGFKIDRQPRFYLALFASAVRRHVEFWVECVEVLAVQVILNDSKGFTET